MMARLNCVVEEKVATLFEPFVKEIQDIFGSGRPCAGLDFEDQASLSKLLKWTVDHTYGKSLLDFLPGWLMIPAGLDS